jgi:hypothetical protein
MSLYFFGTFCENDGTVSYLFLPMSAFDSQSTLDASAHGVSVFSMGDSLDSVVDETILAALSWGVAIVCFYSLLKLSRGVFLYVVASGDEPTVLRAKDDMLGAVLHIACSLAALVIVRVMLAMF